MHMRMSWRWEIVLAVFVPVQVKLVSLNECFLIAKCVQIYIHRSIIIGYVSCMHGVLNRVCGFLWITKWGLCLIMLHSAIEPELYTHNIREATLSGDVCENKDCACS